MTEWISVKDKVPKDGSWCIVCTPSHFQIAEYNENGWWYPAYGCDEWRIYNITHWIPVPKIPPPPITLPEEAK